MDIICPKCAEPCDLDYLHDVVEELNYYRESDDPPVTFSSVRADFQRRGCEALGERHNSDRTPEAAEAAGMLYEILGDDIDGAAAMLDDLGYG